MNEPQDLLTGPVADPPPLIDGQALGDLLEQHTAWSAVPADDPAHRQAGLMVPARL